MYKTLEAQPRKPVSVYTIMTIVFFVVISTGLILLMTMNQPVTVWHAVPMGPDLSTGITPGQELTFGNNNTTVFIPRDAADLSGSLTITPL